MRRKGWVHGEKASIEGGEEEVVEELLEVGEGRAEVVGRATQHFRLSYATSKVGGLCLERERQAPAQKADLRRYLSR